MKTAFLVALIFVVVLVLWLLYLRWSKARQAAADVQSWATADKKTAEDMLAAGRTASERIAEDVRQAAATVKKP